MDKQQFFSQQTFSFFNSQDPNAYNNLDLSFSNDKDAINQNSNQNIDPKQEENTQEQNENQNKQSEKNPEKSSEEKQEQKQQQEQQQLNKQQEEQQQQQEEIQEERKETEEKQFEDQKQQEKKVVKKTEQPKNYGELASQVLKVKEEEIKKSLTKSPIKEQILQNEMKKPLNFFDYIRLFFKKIPSDGLLPNAQKASYTLYEDLKIMEYLGEKNKGNTISQGYKALSNGQILYRSFNSIRSRFEDCLKNLNKQDMCKIMKYIGDSNNLKGFLVFQKTINQQGQTIRTLKEISKSDPKFLVNDPSLSKILKGTKTTQQNKRNYEEISQKPKPLQPLNTKKQLIDNLKYAPKENLEKKIKTNQNIDIIISKPTQQQQQQISQQEKQAQQQQEQQQQIQQKQTQKQQKQQMMSRISVINSKNEEDIRKFQEEKEESSELSSEEIAAIVQLNEAELKKLGSKKLAQIQKTVLKTRQQIHNKQMQNEEKQKLKLKFDTSIIDSFFIIYSKFPSKAQHFF
ncbi:hypothetical protein PPERSA_03447 [Pseudocohnilembus persalinus]|uniref:Uncharacterized protein n=1 Tax=Pseudocohnilembus persalinus TaxID=266149 RepID=A0A0V0QBP8_PSEPJ|nr:hypothetical protein PPERSA_03447 [Pseudocohnilembus persalinus]|eukprot:KRW99646.1 hypothetical protein PPERSA_03447 [Pseudocohnilembus persalinus]